MGRRIHAPVAASLVALGWCCGNLFADPVPVRFREGLVRGFLVLSTLEGERLANGELLQTVAGDRVTSRLVFRFKDGSRSEETAVFTQRRVFRLLTDRLVQKGPAFERSVDLSIDTTRDVVSVRYDDDGREKTTTEQIDLPDDTANGILMVLLKNLPAGAPAAKVSMVAATPKPRLVKLEITPGAEEPFSIGGSPRKAMNYRVHVDIGGITGLIAGIAGKQPPDSHVWILRDEAPAFVKSESPLYTGGPLWRIELTSPVWPKAGGAGR